MSEFKVGDNAIALISKVGYLGHTIIKDQIYKVEKVEIWHDGQQVLFLSGVGSWLVWGDDGLKYFEKAPGKADEEFESTELTRELAEEQRKHQEETIDVPERVFTTKADF